MLSDITLGQYFPGKSPIHKIDPRMKIILLIMYMVIIFCIQNYFSLAIVALAIVAIMLLSGVPVKQYFKSLKMILIIIIITSVLNLFYGSGEPLVSFGVLKITAAGINNAVFICVRIVCLIIASCALTFTTSPTDLTDAIERLL
ncbi:MAG: energy-coupling factor transporter transmembrane component T family protein, partial [Acutalibacteraceae bacterium]